MLLITGATGHSGSYLIKRLQEINYNQPIKCIVRKNSDINILKTSGLNIKYCVGDLNDYDFVEKSMDEVDEVIHIASIIYSEYITKAALKKNINWVLYVHTTGRYSKFKSAAKEYIRIEESVINSGVNYTILRPTMIYGSKKDRNIYQLIDYLYKHKFFPVFGKGLNLMQPIHARDLGEAIFLAFINRNKTINKTYNIAGKYPIAYKQMLLSINNNLKKQNIFIHIPYFISFISAYLYNMFNKNAIISVEQVMRMNEDKTFSYEDAVRDFGFNPVSFEEGIKDEIMAYLSEIGG